MNIVIDICMVFLDLYVVCVMCYILVDRFRYCYVLINRFRDCYRLIECEVLN